MSIDGAAAHMIRRPRVLVAYGSKRGGTAGLAVMIGDALAAAGCDVQVTPAADVHHLAPADGVIIAGALYANRWHRDARRFVRRHTAQLRDTRVWLVGSGPLDDSADDGQSTPPRQVMKCAGRVNAMGAVMFGGRLTPDASGRIAGAMARTRAGDWRNRAQITAFGELVARRLRNGMSADRRACDAVPAGEPTELSSS